MLSFALSASKIKERARVVAMDLQGHGKSSTGNDLDLSIETLCNDVLAVLKTIYGNSPPAIVLVGHSMGGSVAVHVAATKAMDNGTAMAPLAHMQKILSNRMQYFPTIEKAVEWSVRGGPLQNVESARILVPSTLKYDNSKKCFTYRTSLEETEKYWKGWYEGLSEKFLSCPVPKLLLLAGMDRLDSHHQTPLAGFLQLGYVACFHMSNENLDFLQLVKCKASFKWWLSATLGMLYRKMSLRNLLRLY